MINTNQQNFCIAFLEANKGTATEEEKQKFISSLKELHANGQYIVAKKEGGWKISSKNPETLQRQMARFDDMIAAMFERV